MNLNKYIVASNRSLQKMPWLWLVLAMSSAYAETNNSDLAIGKRIYEEGVVANGKALTGQRVDMTEGQEAPACIKCHRKSGMGSLEGNIVVPPVTGRYLFTADEERPFSLLDTRAPRNISQHHPVYTDEMLGKAVREGVNANGKKMNALMPHYQLNDQELKSLSAYLKQLSNELSPGVSDDSVQFATIITPDFDPKEKEIVLKMMHDAFNQRNASQQTSSGRMRMPLDLLPRTYREWKLSVWELTGAPETWQEQLNKFYQQQPVFAVFSGLANNTWQPVHDFCHQQQLPCLFPSAVVPPAETDFYNLYFSKGVVLEAEVLAKQLRQRGEKAPKQLIQIYRDEAQGRAGAQALKQALQGSGIQIEDRVINASSKVALNGINQYAVVMNWLTPPDLQTLLKLNNKPTKAEFIISGYLAKENYSAITKPWLSKVRVIYPYLLDDKRQANLKKLQDWLKIGNIPLINEPLQTDVFFNLLFMTDLTSQILDNFYRDYLLERAEDMLSVGSNITLYPRLGLAAGQRFASKGAYLARFSSVGKLQADSDWLVP